MATVGKLTGPRPNREQSGIILAAAVTAAASLIPLSRAWLTSSDLGHGWAVPLLMGYLWWERWAERPAGVPRDAVGPLWWWTLPALMAVHFSLRLFLTPFPLWPAVLLGYTLVMAGVALASAWLLAGWPAVRWLAPPLILLASAIPLPSAFEAGVTRPCGNCSPRSRPRYAISLGCRPLPMARLSAWLRPRLGLTRPAAAYAPCRRAS